MKTTLSTLLLAVLGLPLLTACQDVPEATVTAEAPEVTGAQGYVPDGQFDAYAVNCKLCDEAREARAAERVTYRWNILRTDDPEWTKYVRDVEARWRQRQADFGPNSDEALVVRDHLVRLYRKAHSWAQSVTASSPAKHEAYVASAEMIEEMLKR